MPLSAAQSAGIEPLNCTAHAGDFDDVLALNRSGPGRQGLQNRLFFQVGHWTALAALRHQVSGARFTLAALCAQAQFENDGIKVHSGSGMAGDLFVGYSLANTNNHGNPVKLVEVAE